MQATKYKNKLQPLALKPVLKWAGGKRWLIPLLQEIWQPYQNAKLVEPFLGGMSVALGLNPQHALLNDANVHLINFYQQLKKGLKISIPFRNNDEYYYQTRKAFNDLILAKKFRSKQAASFFYFLIKTGYNGLCRFNVGGLFNVPFGQYKSIKYKNDFTEYQTLLQKWELKQGDFESIRLSGQEFLYADPPYDVKFTRYTKQDFTWEDQLRLAKWLSSHSGPVVASNAASKRIVNLYQEWNFKIVFLSAPRSIACTGDRKPALEILALKNIDQGLIKNILKKRNLKLQK